jgi:hypothetical protein
MSEGPGAGQVLIGIFLILFGLCITLVGGGCTIMWIMFIANGDTSGAFLFLISLVVLAGGLVTVWAGVKMLRSN